MNDVFHHSLDWEILAVLNFRQLFVDVLES
jgi:hypothetical protein